MFKHLIVITYVMLANLRLLFVVDLILLDDTKFEALDAKGGVKTPIYLHFAGC